MLLKPGRSLRECRVGEREIARDGDEDRTDECEPHRPEAADDGSCDRDEHRQAIGVRVDRPQDRRSDDAGDPARIVPSTHASCEVRASLIPRIEARSWRSATARMRSPVWVERRKTQSAPTQRIAVMRTMIWSEVITTPLNSGTPLGAVVRGR